MALVKDTISVDFTGGLDKKTDPKRVIPGKLTTLQNGIFDTSSSISKGGGYTAGTPNLVAGGTINGTVGMGFTHKDELCQVTTDRFQVLSYSRVSAAWVDKGILPLSTVTKKTVVRNNATQSGLCCARAENIAVFCWEDSRGGIRASVIDELSGVTYQDDVSISGNSAELVRCVSLGGSVYIFFVEGTNVYMRSIAASAPLTFVAAATVATDARGSANRMDAVANSVTGTLLLAYRNNSSGITLHVVNTSGVSTTSTTRSRDPVSSLHLSFFTGSGLTAVFYADTTNGLRATVYGTAPFTGATEATIDNTTTEILHITTARSSTLTVVYELTAAATYNHTVRWNTLTSGAVAGSQATLARSVGLGTQAFFWQSQVHVGLIHESALQPTFFVMGVTGDLAGVISARAAFWTSGPLHTKKRLPNVLREATATVSFPIGEKGRLAFEDGLNMTTVGISRLYLGDASTSERTAYELGGVVHIPGGCPQMYDGKSCVEDGFNLYPENLSVSDSGAGSLSAGAYQWIAVYEWTDAQGNVHQSAASVPAELTLTSESRAVNVVVPTLRLTRKTSPRAEVGIALYRTKAGGNVFYRLVSPSNMTANAPGSDTVTIADSAADSSIDTSQLLYTMGSVLDHEPPPASKFGCVHQERLFLGGLEDPSEYAYSNVAIKGEGITFSEKLRYRLPESAGPLTAVASMDGQALIHTETGMALVSGEGPNLSGQQNGYSQSLLTVDNGAKAGASRSVVVTDEGMWFRSPRGLRMLGRNLAIARGPTGLFVGSEVDPLMTACVAAAKEKSRGQVKWFTGSTVLTWDATWQQWSLLTNHAAVDAAFWNGYVTHLNAAGQPLQSDGSGTHNGTAIALVAETAWLSLAGVSGYQRVYEIQITGQFLATSTFEISVGFDFEDTYAETGSITTGAVFSSGPILLSHKLGRQKCSAVRFKISESGGAGLGFSLTSFALKVGLKTGLNRLPSSRRL